MIEILVPKKEGPRLQRTVTKTDNEIKFYQQIKPKPQTQHTQF